MNNGLIKASLDPRKKGRTKTFRVNCYQTVKAQGLGV